jgi:hypothetical protein
VSGHDIFNLFRNTKIILFSTIFSLYIFNSVNQIIELNALSSNKVLLYDQWTLNDILNATWKGAQSWSWSYGSLIYDYLCNQCISQLTLWVQILHMLGVLDTTYVSDLGQIGGFLRVLQFPTHVKLAAMIWLKYCWR